jgi:Haem-degrading
MVDAAVAKARKIGVTENVAILDDGGNLKAFGRMDGAPILCSERLKGRAIAGPYDYDQIPALVERSMLRVKNFYAAVWLRCPSLPAIIFRRPTSLAW